MEKLPYMFKFTLWAALFLSTDEKLFAFETVKRKRPLLGDFHIFEAFVNGQDLKIIIRKCLQRKTSLIFILKNLWSQQLTHLHVNFT
jgi:hypothetical protein